ncbi:ArnT family glycosyltransferase [Stappia stellulata]|uniref:ArnT family glycosyltransferase n=1 Tax=Stappia stellulata TaxID=71235 RepID=UPI000415FC79|nr:glycosyltransferase family 39 protein [Stappia stellulata]
MSETSAGRATEGFGTAGVRWLRVIGRRGLAPLVLLLLGLVFFAPGLTQVPPLDRDEPRFAQATKQMVESRDFIDIRFQETARHKKPVGIYWLQSAVVEASGLGRDAPIWVYRLPSQLGALLAVLLTYWCVRAFAAPGVAFVAGALVAASLIVGVEARLAKTDAMLLASILAAQGALARIWLERAALRGHPLLAALFWGALGVSVLIKGPVGPLVVGLTVVLLSAVTRDFGWIRLLYPLRGIAAFLLLVLPWFVAIYLQTDGAFFAEAIGKDLLGKVATGQESHGAPPLTHLAAALGTFWPLSAFMVLALPGLIAARRAPAVIFALCWIAPTWVIFEFTATKLPHYTLPLLPGVALLAAVLLSRQDEPPSKGWRYAAAGLLFVPVAGVAAANFIAGPIVGAWPSPPGAVIAALALAPGITAMRHMARGAALRALPTTLLAGFLLIVATWGFTLPALSPIWVSPRLADAVAQEATCPAPRVANVGFNEPSYIFLQGTDTLPTSAQGAARFLVEADGEADGGCRIAVVDTRHEADFLSALAALGVTRDKSSVRVTGLNINGGDEMDIGLYSAQETGRE